ncbi:murein transglycosylase A [Roseitalea porphyridii]|uniref:murein transglycosylase A n=1 Tax=Roseitalea porphyridii TaxID=1852022 RepID=UPI0032EDDCA7
MIRWIALLLLLPLLLVACDRKPGHQASQPASKPQVVSARPLPPPPVPPARGPFGLTRLDFEQLPGWYSDDPAEAIVAFRRSCETLLRRPGGASVDKQGRFGRVADWAPACSALGEPEAYDAASARRYFENWFQPFMVAGDGRSEGLFTGYYEAEVKGSLRQGGDYQWPLYRPPGGKVGDRASIDAGELEGRGLEIAWLDDPVSAFDLHIQGSARVAMPDGSYRRVGYAGTNGMTFVGIGRLMLNRGLIGPDQASAQGVKAWLRANPREARELMQENPRYVFFRWIDGAGPIGAQGVPLTAGRSMAVDPAYLGYGMPVFLETTYSDGRPLNRLMIAQDTGGAIKGAVRGDLFWGTGAPALAIAGGMKQKGRYYVFLPKTLNRFASR